MVVQEKSVNKKKRDFIRLIVLSCFRLRFPNDSLKMHLIEIIIKHWESIIISNALI